MTLLITTSISIDGIQVVETPPNLGTKETQLASNWEPFREHNLSQGTPCCIIRKAPTRIPARFSSSWHHYQQDWETSARERLLFSVFVLFWDVLHCLPCFTHLRASCCSWCAAFMTPKVRQISIWGPSPQFWAGALCAVAIITCRKKCAIHRPSSRLEWLIYWQEFPYVSIKKQ